MLMRLQNSFKQLICFCLVGIFAVSIDYSIYIFTRNSIGLVFSKLLGFYSGVFFSFLLNSFFTFREIKKSFLSWIYFVKYILVLSVNMCVNVFINYFLLNYFSSINNITFLAFLIATCFSMFSNFIGMKILVFK